MTVVQLAQGQVEADRASALGDQPPPALAGTAADLENPLAGDVAEQPGVGLVEPFG